ncbi:hypothetical protein GW813_02855 [bacterium]|nr:hypothetical protein [bacterium]
MVSRCQIIANYRRLAAVLPAAQLFYAVKANPQPEILAALAEIGAGFDVASRGEILAAVEAGANPRDDLIFADTVKDPRHISYASSSGLDDFTFDNAGELTQIARHAPGSRVHVRLAVSNHGRSSARRNRPESGFRRWTSAAGFPCVTRTRKSISRTPGRAGGPATWRLFRQFPTSCCGCAGPWARCRPWRFPQAQTFDITPGPNGAVITMTYAVGGYASTGLEAIGPVVDGVLATQLQRLGRTFAGLAACLFITKQ